MGEWWWDKYYNSVPYYRVYAALVNAAEHRGLVTYQEIARLIGVPVTGSYMGREVGGVIGAVSQNEMDAGRPMLSAIVVGVSGLPGDGFYAWARDLGRYDGSEDKEAKLRFWEEEKQAVYEAWQKEYSD